MHVVPTGPQALLQQRARSHRAEQACAVCAGGRAGGGSRVVAAEAVPAGGRSCLIWRGCGPDKPAASQSGGVALPTQLLATVAAAALVV